MKTRKLFSAMAMVAIIALALAVIGCKEDDPTPTPTPTPTGDTPKVQPDTPRSLSFTGGHLEGINGPWSVTIKSDEKFTATEWETLVGKVIAAIMRGYNYKSTDGAFNEDIHKGIFETIFATNRNISIVLLESTTIDCEVKSDNYRKMYLKISALDTIDLQPAVKIMDTQTGSYPE
jgi:hypothetical protein